MFTATSVRRAGNIEAWVQKQKHPTDIRPAPDLERYAGDGRHFTATTSSPYLNHLNVYREFHRIYLKLYLNLDLPKLGAGAAPYRYTIMRPDRDLAPGFTVAAGSEQGLGPIYVFKLLKNAFQCGVVDFYFFIRSIICTICIDFKSIDV